MKKVYRKISILLIMIFSISLITTFSYADSGSGFYETTFGSKTKLWENTDSGISGSRDIYPFKKDKPEQKNNSVGFDIIYGTSKGLVKYTGEIPFYETRDEDENVYAGMSGIPYRRGTTINNADTKHKNPGKVSVKSYWGTDSITTDEVSKAGLEDINKDDVVSLRLYALSNVGLSHNWLYSISSFLVKLETKIISVIVAAKNIDITQIMEALKLDKLNKIINELFLIRTSASGARLLSPFALICLVAYIISLTAFVFRYITGGPKAKALWSDIIVLFLVGFIITGAALTGNATKFANIGSKLVNNVMIDMNSATNDDLGLFTTKITGGNDNSNIYLNEMSVINRIYINTQICTQFGVKDISKLSFDNLGDSGGASAKNTLKGISDPKDVGNNLGYYFWFANSGAKKVTTDGKLPKVDESQSKKLGSMMTYLQKRYNSGSDTNKELIKGITTHFSNPTGTDGFVFMLLLAVEFALLFLCLYKYALKAALGKVELMVGSLGLAIAGPLIFSTNKKMVNTGKGILGIFVTAFIKIVLFGTFFDLVLFVIATIIKVDFIVLVVTCIVTGIFLYISPLLENKLDELMSAVERSISPQGMRLKQQTKEFARRKVSQAKSNAEAEANEGKIVGYDENGNPIYKKSRGNLKLLALGAASAALTDNAMQRDSLFALGRRSSKLRAEDSIDAQHALENAELAKASAAKQSLFNEMKQKTADKINSIYDRETGTYDTDKLSSEELGLHNDMLSKQNNVDMLQNNSEYKQLKAKERASNLTEEERQKLLGFEQEIINNKAQENQSRQKLNKAIEARATSETQDKYRDKIAEAVEKEDKALDTINVKSDVVDSNNIRSKLKNEKVKQALDNNESVVEANKLNAEEEQFATGLTTEINKAKNDSLYTKASEKIQRQRGSETKTSAVQSQDVKEKLKDTEANYESPMVTPKNSKEAPVKYSTSNEDMQSKTQEVKPTPSKVTLTNPDIGASVIKEEDPQKTLQQQYNDKMKQFISKPKKTIQQESKSAPLKFAEKSVKSTVGSFKKDKRGNPVFNKGGKTQSEVEKILSDISKSNKGE